MSRTAHTPLARRRASMDDRRARTLCAADAHSPAPAQLPLLYSSVDRDQASISTFSLLGSTASTSSISPGVTCSRSTRDTAVTASDASVSPAM